MFSLLFSKYSCFSMLLSLNCLRSAICENNDASVRVAIDNDAFKGFIVGKTFQDEGGFDYMGFRGIPYAKPPINGLRFKDPQKLDKFEGTFDATNDGFECCSFTASNCSEDCLNLNVYTKELKPDDLKPVVVLIHPGGLYVGSGASYYMRPGHMMSQDWVVVTFNYRLGALGFLNLGTADIPGNGGFKDQVYALRWVQKFIENFGGNPRDISLMGYSAGGLSVQMHLLSSMSENLFHKALIMSGSLPAQVNLPPVQQKYLAVRLAKRLKCAKFLAIEEEIPYGVNNKFSDYDDVDNEEILQCLNQHNGLEISSILGPMFEFPKDNPIWLWLPVIEKDFQQERFLTQDLIVKRKPALIGYTNGELCLSAKDILEVENSRKRFSEEFKAVAARTFLYERHPNRQMITERLLGKYLNNSLDLSMDNYNELCDLFSDAIIRFGAHKFAEILAQHQNPVYFYEFTFLEDYKSQEPIFPDEKGGRELLQDIFVYLLNKSSARCDHMIDFQYLFNWPNRRHNTEKQKSIIRLYTGFIYDFVKNGKLSDIKATPYPNSYALINDHIEYVQGRNFKNYEFWLKLFPDYFNFKLK